MIIRLAQLSDAAAIRQLITSLAHCYTDNSQSALPGWFLETITEQAICERVKSDNYLTYVYLEKDSLIGYLLVKDNSHLCHMFVQAEHQGKGVSRQLWQSAKKANNCTKYTVRSSLNAIAVYKRFGFEITGLIESNEGISYQSMEYVLRN